jgi:hypothetical protein
MKGAVMAHYETHIGKVADSTFAIGDRSAAYGSVPIDPKYRDVAQRLTDLIGVLAEYGDTTKSMMKIRDLADEAQDEVHSASPDKQCIRRLLASMRAVLVKAGPGIVGAGALAEAITKIADAIQHL